MQIAKHSFITMSFGDLSRLHRQVCITSIPHVHTLSRIHSTVHMAVSLGTSASLASDPPVILIGLLRMRAGKPKNVLFLTKIQLSTKYELPSMKNKVFFTIERLP